MPAPEFNQEQHDAMHAEYEAWQAVVFEFKALGLDMNRDGNGEALASQVRWWGEELARLRRTASDEEVAHWRAEQEAVARKHTSRAN